MKNYFKNLFKAIIGAIMLFWVFFIILIAVLLFSAFNPQLYVKKINAVFQSLCLMKENESK